MQRNVDTPGAEPAAPDNPGETGTPADNTITDAAETLQGESYSKGDSELGARVDKDGTAFDPAYHSTDKDGEPLVTKKGRFRKRREDNPGGIGAAANVDGEAAAARNIGTIASSMFVGVCTGFGGAQWKPSRDEDAMLEKAFQDYAESKGMIDLPPGICLIAMVGVYVAPRFAKVPNKGKRLANLWEKFRKQTTGIKAPVAPVAPAAPAETKPDPAAETKPAAPASPGAPGKAD